MKIISSSFYSSSVLVIPEIMISKQSYIRKINLLFFGVLGLSLGYVLARTTYSLTFLYQGLELISLLLIFYSLFRLTKISVSYSYFNLILVIYLFWQLLILFRGNYTDITYFDLKQLLFDLNYGAFVLFIPFVGLLPLKLIVLKKLFQIIPIFGFLFLFLAIVNLKILLNPDLLDLDSLGMIETYAKYLIFPLGLLALNFDLLEKRDKILVVVLFLSVLFFAIVRARRGLIFIQLSVIAISFFISFYKSNRKLSFSIFLLYFLFVFYFMSYPRFNILNLSIFENITERGFENTRLYVESCFFNDMNVVDWIIGKGYNSGYRCPGVDDSIFKDGIRTVIETDYLQLIMLGGFINLFLLFMCICPALYLGLFNSNSFMIKSLCCYIIIWIISLYPSNVYSFNLYHISIWISVGICYSKSFRELSQDDIRAYFLKEINVKNSIPYHG